MQHCESINLDEYRQSGEGGTAITYKHNSRNSLAKLYKSGFEADMAIEEFKVAQAVYDLGIPTPKPYRLVTDGNHTLWIDIGQFGYGAPEWDLGWFWTITHNLGDNRADFLLHLTQETLVSFWDAFLPAYLGTSAPTALREYTRKILAYYAVRVPFMFNLVHHDKFPEEGYKSLIGLIP